MGIFEPLKRSLRDKLKNAVDEAVAPHTTAVGADLHQQVGAARQELADLRREVADVRAFLDAHDVRLRRDVRHAADIAAVRGSARFAAEHMATTPALPDARATLEHGLKLAPSGGLALEFGVWSGSTLRVIADARSGTPVYGFDSFEGLPEDWRTGFPAGAFPADGLPDVPGAELVVGLFADTLPGFLAEHDGPVDFVHVDCDLYSATVTVLEHVGPRLRAGSVLVFDEYFNYPGWERHEHRAWMEHVERTGTTFTYEGYAADNEQVIVRVTAA